MVINREQSSDIAMHWLLFNKILVFCSQVQSQLQQHVFN